MARPASTAAAAAEGTEKPFDSIVICSSQSSEGSTDDEHDSTPLSPEIGMGNPVESDFGDPELENTGKQGVADEDVSGTPAVEQEYHNSASEIESERYLGDLARSQQSSLEIAQSSYSTQLTTPTLTCPPIRRSARAKGALVYDQKYHPLDDVIRPSQAAKRRSLHGEPPVLGSGSACGLSEVSGSDFENMVEDQDGGSEESQPPKQGCKRKRLRSSTPEPTRRSSRRKYKPKVSYDMRIHPQDSDLQRLWACDGSKSSPLSTKLASSADSVSSTKNMTSEDFEETCRLLLLGDAEDYLSEPASEPFAMPSADHGSASHPATKDNAIHVDTHPDVRPDIACRPVGRYGWPIVRGLPFKVFTERIEDQLSAEAEAASPFHYEDGDKENDVTNPELVPSPNPLDGISIIPASQYRRVPELYSTSGHNSIASNAFYVQPGFESPYGLGWSEGIHEMHINDANHCPLPDYLRILASSERLPRAPTPTESSHSYGGHDSTCSSSTGRRKVPELLR